MDYKERIEAAKEQLKAADAVEYKLPDSAHAIRTTVYAIFPELCESEDERVRKAILELVRQSSEVLDKQNQNNMIAWLEKQCKEDSSIQQAYEWGYTEGKRIERKHWIEKQKFSEDYNSIDPQFGKPIEQNPAWSKEDEEMFEYTINLLNYNLGCRKWLKSLKERYTWKPSDKQMHAFEQVYDWYNNNFAPSETLTSLYNDLKKLREE